MFWECQRNGSHSDFFFFLIRGGRAPWAVESSGESSYREWELIGTWRIRKGKEEQEEKEEGRE